MPVETEIKLRWDKGAAALEPVLTTLGYRAQGAGEMERDQVYDRSQGQLRQAGCLLRLRSTPGRWTVTYKGPVRKGPHKSREEIEADVSDGEAFRQILGRLGYETVFRYEKLRTKFSHPSQPGLVTLDQTPIGDFLELEGPAGWIDRTAADLGFGASDYITASYASLYEEYRKTHGALPTDMTY